MTPRVGGEETMEDRLRGAEGRLGTLEEWRTGRVDPFMDKGGQQLDDFGKFVVKFEASDAATRALNAERHESNKFRLNLIAAIATIGLLIIGFMEYTKH